MPLKPDTRRLGRWQTTTTTGEPVRTFIPPPLPPDPLPAMAALYRKLETASQALGRLDGVSTVLPDASLFLYNYVRKEALLSSQIEGTQSSLSDLLLFELDEAPSVPLDDVVEVSSYVAAMDHGIDRLAKGMPISGRLIRDIHGVLLAKGRGAEQQPGEFRRSQNWIGGTRPGNALFVPPPPEHVPDLVSDLERFIHAEKPVLPVLIRAGLVHVQFETIHPFLDGNGRLGRLLITLMLIEAGVLKEPILYLSLYLKTNRNEYYELLQRVRKRGDWEAWLDFFLTGVTETANQAAETARQILDLFEADRHRIAQLGRPAASALRVHQQLQQRPLIAIQDAATRLGISTPTIGKSIRHLEDLGIVKEITGRQRGRVFIYSAYLAILSTGTEPLAR